MLYFPSGDVHSNFLRVISYIERWAAECQGVMKPLVKQLEKFEGADTFHSLLKFVYYFKAVMQEKLEKLSPDYILPGVHNGK